MTLRFTCSPEALAGREHEAKAAIRAIYPDAVLKTAKSGAFLVELSDSVNENEAFRNVQQALYAIGLTVLPAIRSPFTDAPQESEKAPRTVKRSTFILSLIAAVLVAALIGVFVGALLPAAPLGTEVENEEDYVEKIALIDSFFREFAIVDSDGNLLLDAMLKAYVAATGDRYAAYYTEEEYQALASEQQADGVGIGIMVAAKDDTILVIDVVPDGPADKAGVLPGDRIVSVGSGEDKLLVKDVGYRKASAALIGEKGTVAAFTVQRGEEEISFLIERAAYTARAVMAHVSETDPAVGFVRITSFNLVAPAQFKEAVDGLLDSGCTDLVIDLRDNPGGDVRSLTAIASYFLQSGDLITTTRLQNGDTTEKKVEAVTNEGAYAGCSVSEEDIGRYRELPVVILVNGKTASAAELLTAALSDYEIATVVGETTCGKGVFQYVFSLDKWGFSGALRLTAGYYDPPKSENYDGEGITPDEVVTLETDQHLYLLPEAEDTQLQRAIEILQQ